MITLITVTFNAIDTLERTLRSVEQQTYRRVQHIIKDGGSKDGTVALAEAYKRRNPQADIIVVSERDKGLYDAMNTAIGMATGDYVCFLNAGDKLHAPDTLQRLVESIPEGVEAGVVYGDTDIVDDDGRFIRKRRLSPPERLQSGSFRSGMMVCHQAFYANRKLIPLYDTSYRFSADFDWCVKIMKEAEKQGLPLVNTHLVLADYLSEGMTTRNHKASLRERFRIMVKHWGWISTLAYHAWFVVRGIVKK